MEKEETRIDEDSTRGRGINQNTTRGNRNCERMRPGSRFRFWTEGGRANFAARFQSDGANEEKIRSRLHRDANCREPIIGEPQ